MRIEEVTCKNLHVKKTKQINDLVLSFFGGELASVSRNVGDIVLII